MSWLKKVTVEPAMFLVSSILSTYLLIDLHLMHIYVFSQQNYLHKKRFK